MMYHPLVSIHIHKIWLIILILCSFMNAMGQHANDTIPRFEIVSVNGNIPETKPQLAQRINGSTELIIVYPSNSSILDELICTSLYDYFSSLGISVSYHYAPYNKEQIPGNINLLQGSCSLTDIDFVKNANTLVMIPNYNWGYSGYSNRLDIHLNIYDIVGGYYWKEIIDELRIDAGKHKMDKKLIKKLIKKLQKQVTPAYTYNPEFSVSPIRIKFNWGERDFKKFCDNNSVV